MTAVLDPDIVLRSDGGATRPSATEVVRGAENVNGAAGVVAIDVLADPERLRQLDLTLLEG